MNDPWNSLSKDEAKHHKSECLFIGVKKAALSEHVLIS